MIPPLTAAERAEITQQSLGRERVSQEDTLRAERYFKGRCVCCGGTPTVAFNPLLPGALTHCGQCVKVELSAQENDTRIRAKMVKLGELEKAKQMRAFANRRTSQIVRTELERGEEDGTNGD